MATASLAVAVMAVGAFHPSSAAVAEATPPLPITQSPTSQGDDVTDVVGDGDRDQIIGGDWEQSADSAVVGVGDPFGFHLYRAAADQGYAWERIATLSVMGVETDAWIGNVCTTIGSSYAGVVYAPRGMTNDEWYFQSGAWAAIVDLTTGEVTDLGAGYSLAYFNPACGSDASVTFSRFADGATDVAVYDAAAGAASQVLQVEGQLTSPVLAGETLVGALGAGLVEVNGDGSTATLVETQGAPFDLTVGSDDSIAFLEEDGEEARLSVLAGDGELTESVATADLTDLALERTGDGGIVAIGSAIESSDLPVGINVIEGPSTATPSSEGTVLVAPPTTVVASDDSPTGESIQVEAEFLATGESVTFDLPVDGPDAASSAVSASPTVAMSTPQSPVDTNRTCAVPRNDPQSQALQPLPRQVEWAADLAVQGLLTINRPANHNGWGLPAYTPQGMFPRIPLDGGGRIPVQILLGVLAQESNLWQASRFTTPGQSGNPLIGNYYGINTAGSASDPNFWSVQFPDADCGYGVGQITDGMRLAGQELQGGVPAYPVNQQRAIGLDYAANIAMAVRILADKWNTTRAGGLTINDGSPQYIENWFFAVWAYNTGYYPQGAADEPWGVGWSNNPVNPNYPPNRGSFLNGSPSDAATPQDWPYPERVMGFAAHGLELIERQGVGSTTYVQGYRTAWWPGVGNMANLQRERVQPPRTLFCNVVVNDCNPLQATPCLDPGFKCWWNGNVTWKQDCASQCGREFMRFSPASSYMSEQPNGTSWPPSCNRAGLPAGALIVDDLPLSTASGTIASPPRRCTATATTGSFSFNLGQGYNGAYPNTIDLHQLSGGLNDHFYFSRMWGGTPSTVPDLRNGDDLAPIVGTWSLGQAVSNQWMRVWVHTPDHGAWSQQAVYDVQTANGTVSRTLQQRTYANSWQELGSFPMNGIPTVSMQNRATAAGSNATFEDAGIVDVAWDAVAFEPLPQAPSDFVVSLGDSYSSGEGSPGSTTGWPYWAETNNLSSSSMRNACHRSDGSWVQRLQLAPGEHTLSSRQQFFSDPDLSFRQVACSGAVMDNITVAGQYGEPAQLDQGYLDESTTLVTLTIGGNDVGFGAIITRCVENGFIGGDEANCAVAAHPDGTSRTLAEVTSSRIDDVRDRLPDVLAQIAAAAPNAEILLLGYPPIFDDGTGCTLIAEGSQPWLESVGQDLEAAQQDAVVAAQSAGVPVHFQSVAADWDTHGVCGSDPGITSMMLSSSLPSTAYGSTGEVPILYVAPGLQLTVSQQSFHPNNAGSTLMAVVASNAIATFY